MHGVNFDLPLCHRPSIPVNLTTQSGAFSEPSASRDCPLLSFGTNTDFDSPITCSHCGQDLSAREVGDRSVCPKCGAAARAVKLELKADAEVFAGLRAMRWVRS